MGLFTAATINAISDKTVAGWQGLLGTTGSGLGVGDGTFGYSKKLSDLSGIISSLGDAGQEAILAPIVQNWPGSDEAAEIWNLRLDSFFAGLDREARLSSSVDVSITNLDKLMSWFNFRNAVTYWQCLAHMDWVPVFNAIHGVNPDHHNVYYEVLQAGTYGGNTFTNALAKLVVVSSTPTTTAGFTISPATYSGGFAYVNCTALVGTGLVTVTGLDQDGNAETWTATVSGTGRVLLTPTNRAYSLITKANTVAVAAGITGCTIYIEANRPATRSNPPT